MDKRLLSSIRLRLTFWYSGVLALLVITFAVASFVIVRIVLGRRADRLLTDVAATIGDELNKNWQSHTAFSDAVHEELREFRFREIQLFVLVNDSVIGRSAALPNIGSDSDDDDALLSVTALQRAIRAHPADTSFSLRDDEGGYRVAQIRTSRTGGALTVAAVQSWHGYAETLETIALVYYVSVPLLMLVATAGGYWLAARSLSPVAEMGRKAASIGRLNLGERLVAPNPSDELGALAAVFNEMLARLETAFAQQQHFMQDASHELRSPVTAIRMEADVALQQEHRDESDYRDSLATIGQASTRLSKIVDDLFFLARHDATREHGEFTRIDLGEAVHEAVRSLRSQALARGIRIEFDDPPELPVHGVEIDVVRIVVNLLENAIKYSPIGSAVRVSISQDDPAMYCVRIVDSGKGVAEASRSRIFDRFFREGVTSADAMSDVTLGGGLGLPIARTIAEALGGSVELESTSPAGSTFAFCLPRAER